MWMWIKGAVRGVDTVKCIRHHDEGRGDSGPGAWRNVEGDAGREDCEQTSLFLVKEVGRVNR